jgi:hypothetical protein
MKVGEKVKLKTFNAKTHSNEIIHHPENYWILVGKTGIIQQDPKEHAIYASFSKEPRVLVKFDEDLINYGLISHNNIENSLWILVEDLEIVM